MKETYFRVEKWGYHWSDRCFNGTIYYESEGRNLNYFDSPAFLGHHVCSIRYYWRYMFLGHHVWSIRYYWRFLNIYALAVVLYYLLLFDIFGERWKEGLVLLLPPDLISYLEIMYSNGQIPKDDDFRKTKNFLNLD